MTLTVDILLALIGAFYAFAGVVGVRAAHTSRAVDAALERITLSPGDDRERRRGALLVAMSALVFLGGLVLLARLDLARVLFVAASLAQVAYIWVLAPRYLDGAEGPDAAGRQRTINAFVIHIAATLVVVVAGAGRLFPLGDAPLWSLALAGLGAVLFTVYVIRASLAVRGLSRS